MFFLGRGVKRVLSFDNNRFVFCKEKSLTCKVFEGSADEVIPETVLTDAISREFVPTLTTFAKTGFGKDVSVYLTRFNGLKLFRLKVGEFDNTVLVFKT